jgi:quercetin dioxygenase-like cupin family protein
VIHQGPCDGPEKPCHKTTSQYQSIKKRVCVPNAVLWAERATLHEQNKSDESQMTQDTSTVTGPDGPQSEIRIGQLAVRFLVDGPASGASVTIFELTVPPGAKVPAAHSHDAFDETIFGLEGVLTLTLNCQPVEVGAGEALFIPRGAAHRFDNPLAATARALAVITPGVLGSSYFREIAAIANAAAGGPPDAAAIAAVMLRHGLTPAS